LPHCPTAPLRTNCLISCLEKITVCLACFHPRLKCTIAFGNT
jgi:hypothetical protein